MRVLLGCAIPLDGGRKVTAGMEFRVEAHLFIYSRRTADRWRQRWRKMLAIVPLPSLEPR